MPSPKRKLTIAGKINRKKDRERTAQNLNILRKIAAEKKKTVAWKSAEAKINMIHEKFGLSGGEYEGIIVNNLAVWKKTAERAANFEEWLDKVNVGVMALNFLLVEELSLPRITLEELKAVYERLKAGGLYRGRI